MNLNRVTVEEIQPQNVRSETGFSNDVKIRHAWVKQLPDLLKERIEHQVRNLGWDVRSEFYRDIDREVGDRWIEMMKQNFTINLSTAVKSASGELRLADHLCNQTDELLLLAAEEVVLSILSTQ